MISLFRRKSLEPRLPYTVDIHSHILPGVDDGAPDAATGAELVERMASWGISHIIATPHVANESFENTSDILDPALDDLRAELQRRDIPVMVDRSAEYRIDPLFKSLVDNGTVTPMPGRYLLVENPFRTEPPGLESFLLDLRNRGYHTILAHPERYLYYSDLNPARYEYLYRSGTFFQVNLLSLAGYYGKAEKLAALRLVRHGLVDFLATDLHNHRQADAIEAFLASKEWHKMLPALSDLQNDTLKP